MKVLLVATDDRVRTQVKTATLGMPDVEFFDVGTPHRALQQLDDVGGFDIVIADNDTRPAGGYYLAREMGLRVQMGREDLPPVVLLLARTQDQWLSNWSQADAYVMKPVDPFNLTEAVEALVDNRPIPKLPGVGGNPTPSVLDTPGPDATPQRQADMISDREAS